MDALSYVFDCGHTSASAQDVTEVASFFCFKLGIIFFVRKLVTYCKFVKKQLGILVNGSEPMLNFNLKIVAKLKLGVIMKTYYLLFAVFIALSGFASAQFQNESLSISQADISKAYGDNVISLDNQFNKTLLIEKLDPGHAMLMSAVWPGLGQFYNGPTETTKGTIMAIGQGGLFILMIVGALNPSEPTVSNTYSSINVNVASAINPLLWVGLIGMLGNSIYSIIDAGNRAKELNAEEGFSFQINMFNNLPHLIGTNISNKFSANLSFKINL
jgi:hypothetical protein